MTLFASIKNRPAEFGFILLFILPPLGIAWLAGLGLREWTMMIRKKMKIATDPVSVLFILLILASIGATATNGRIEDLLSTVMLTAYFGIYLYLMNNPGKLRLSKYLWITIMGGAYLYFSNWFFDLVGHFVTIPAGVSLLTGHLLMGFNRQDRLYGSAYNPNYACYLLILALALLMVELLRSIRLRNINLIAFELVLLAVLSMGIYATGSRAGFVIMLMVLMFFVFKWNTKLFLAAFVASAVSIPLLVNVIPRGDSAGFSMQQRIDIWKNSVAVFLRHPLFGTTSFDFSTAYYQLTGHSIAHAHNLFLSIFASSGVISGVYFTGLIIAGSVSLLKAVRTEKGYLSHRVTLYLFSLPTIIAYGLLDFTLSSPQVMLVVLALVSFWIRDERRRRLQGHSLFPMPASQSAKQNTKPA
jgi:O-Antigen ligase.